MRNRVHLWENKAARIGVSLLLAFLFTLGLPAMLHGQSGGLDFTNSAASVLVFLSMTFLFDRILSRPFQSGKRKWIPGAFFGILFSLCMSFGSQLDQRESIPFTSPSLWLSAAVLGFSFTLAVRYFWDRLAEKLSEKHKGQERAAQANSMPDAGMTDRKYFFLTAAVILLCFVPVFLAAYPGFFVYDAQDEYVQVAARNFSTHHPLLHVLVLGGIIQLVHKLTGSYNLGIACYTCLQMICLSGIFAYVVLIMRKRGISLAGRILSTLYFGLCPVVVMFSLCSAKDGLFTGCMLLAVICLQELCRDPEAFWKNKGFIALFSISGIIMLLLRHNGLYAFVVMIPLFILWLKRERRKTLWLFLAVAAGAVLTSGLLALALRADSSENQEMLTVPIQQMARVYKTAEDSLTQKEKDTLYEILPREALERYTPKVSDGVKAAFDNQAYRSQPGKYRKLWLSLGLKHPFTYLNAWFMTSYGFWYPDTVIDVYRGNSVFTFTYEDSSYFGFEVEQPGERRSLFPALLSLYRNMSLEIFQQRIPVVSMLFSPGFLFWVWLFVLGFWWYQGEGKKGMPFLLPLLVWLTVILGPTFLVRYVLFLWFLLPLLMVGLFDKWK